MPVFGGTEKQQTSSETTATIKDKSTSTTKGKSTQEQKSTGTTRALSEEVTSLFEGLLTQLAGSASGGSGDTEVLLGELTSLARGATAAAGSAEANINALIDPIVANSRRLMERDIRGRETRLSLAGGGALSSNVQQLGSQFRAEAESQIAAQEGQLRLAGRTAAQQERTSAAQLSAGAVDARQRNVVEQMALIGDILKGAAVEAEQQVVGKTKTESQTIEDLLRQLTQTTKGKSKGTSELGAGSAALATLGVLSQF